MKNHSFQAGWASLPLPLPDAGVMAGYGSIDDEIRQSDGVHDMPKVRAAAFAVNGQLHLLLHFDLLAVDRLLTSRINRLIQKMEIQPDTVTYLAVHTHAGPGGLLDTTKPEKAMMTWFVGARDDELADEVARTAFKAVLDAMDQLSDAQVSKSVASIAGIASNRVNPDTLPDTHAPVYEINNSHGTAVFVLFACHPTVLGPKNTLFSADFPSMALDLLQEFGIDELFFLNGACGDLSCRYTRRKADFEEARRLGTHLGAAILNARPFLEPVKIDAIEHRTVKFSLACRRAVDLRQLMKRSDALELYIKKHGPRMWTEEEDRKVDSEIEAIQADMLYTHHCSNLKSLQLSVPIFKIGDHFFAAIPGELFSSLGADLKKHGIDVLCYANDYYLYLADKNAHDQKTYEACSSFFKKGEAEQMVRDIIQIAENWRNEQ